MRKNLLGEHVEVRSHNIIFIMSLLFVSSPIRFTMGILIDSFKAGARLGNKIRAMCDSDGGRGNLYVGRGYGSISEASTVGGEENAFNV